MFLFPRAFSRETGQHHGGRLSHVRNVEGIMKRILLVLLLVAGTALAGTDQESDAIPFWRMQRLNATELAEKGPNGEPSEATDAFNYLQDKLGKPHVKEVTYDPDADRFRWRGPVSGR
jgi:hypothetical protein